MKEDIFKVNPDQTERINSIYQLTDMPDKVIDSEEDCYVRYENAKEELEKLKVI